MDNKGERPATQVSASDPCTNRDHLVHKNSFLNVMHQSVIKKGDDVFATWYDSYGRSTSEYTFHELWEEAGTISHYLRTEWNLKKGDRAVLCYNVGLHFFAAFLGCLRAGVVAVLVYPPAEPLSQSLLNMNRVVRDCGAELILTDSDIKLKKMADTWNLFSNSRHEWPADNKFRVTDNLRRSKQSQKPRLLECDAPTSLDDLAFLQYTSGSTGDPKGVMVSFGALAANVKLNCDCIYNTFRDDGGIPDTIIGFSWLPPYHDMGLVLGIIVPFVAGWRQHMMSPVTFIQKPLLWLQLMSRLKVSWGVSPDFGFRLVARKFIEARRMTSHENPIANLDLSCIRWIMNASEPVRLDTRDYFGKLFSKYGLRDTWFHVGYGPAENVVGVCYTHGYFRSTPRKGCQNIFVASGDANKFPPSVSIKIVDPKTSTEVSNGEIGEIWISGPSVASGYFRKPELSKEVFCAKMVGSKQDFLRSGDLGFLENDGLFICGRIKDLIIINGVNYYPQDIECAVEKSSPAVRPGCVAAFTSGDASEEVEVVFEIRSGSCNDAASVIQAVRCNVAKSVGLILARVVAIKERTIAKTTSGKIKRNANRNLLHGGKLHIVLDDCLKLRSICQDLKTKPFLKPSECHTRMSTKILAELQALLGFELDQQALDLTLPELGLSSLQIIEFAQHASVHRHSLSPEVMLTSPLRELLQALHSNSSDSNALKWDLRSQFPHLFSSLCTQQPQVLEIFEEMSAAIPIPPTNGTFDDGIYFRPEGHFRAFYRHGDGSFVIAIKGAEVKCDDQLGFLQILQQRAFERFEVNSITNTLEYFLIQERKIPGALTLPEALSEADKAARLQMSLLDRFGIFGSFPVPLLIRSWSRGELTSFDARLRPLVSGTLHGILDRELERGLACYVYYFPDNLAERVSHYANRLSTEALRTGHGGMRNTRLIHTTLTNDLDPGEVIKSWIDLVSNMLAVGWFPCNTKNFKNGQCIEPQNVLINGAIADMDSVVQFEELDSDKAFYEHLLATLHLLTRILRTFLFAETNGTTERPPPFPSQFSGPDFLDTLGVIYIWERLKDTLCRTGEVDHRLSRLVQSDMCFDTLFNDVLYQIYYRGPEIPEAALHLLNVTNVYTCGSLQARVDQECMSTSAELEIDSAAVVTVPQVFLRQLKIPASDFITIYLRNKAELVTIYDTFLGRIGIIVVPVQDGEIHLDRAKTQSAIHLGLVLAQGLGAKTVSLTGMIPSATDYGALLSSPEGGPSLTTGHGTTIAACVLMLERVLQEGGVDVTAETMAFLGLGSIGTGLLKLFLLMFPHPESLILCDLPAKADELRNLTIHLRHELGFQGKIETTFFQTELPAKLYQSRCIFSATGMPNILDVNRLQPGTILLDDSAPHCFNATVARRRFQQHRDLLFSEAGAICINREIKEIHDLGFSTGWDGKIRSALGVLHPDREVVMGCVFSSILSERYRELGHTIGLVDVKASQRHLDCLRNLGFTAAPLYCGDFSLDEELIGEFRCRYGRVRNPTSTINESLLSFSQRTDRSRHQWIRKGNST